MILPKPYQDIDKIETLGLLGVEDSLAYRSHELEKHFHNNEYWFGAAITPNGEIHVADEIGPSVSPFAFIAGNNAWGSWVQVLGSGDSPVKPGNLKLDAHNALVTTTNNTEAFFVQFVSGESANLAAAILSKNYTILPYISATNNADSGTSEFRSLRIDAGVKVWARSICPGENAPTINLYLGTHEYIG